jgi:hypothetical protein
MTSEEYLKEISQYHPPLPEGYTLKLTWYDEYYREFVACVDREGDYGEVNYPYEWKEFVCNMTLEEFQEFLPQLRPDTMSEKQREVIMDYIKRKETK